MRKLLQGMRKTQTWLFSFLMKGYYFYFYPLLSLTLYIIMEMLDDKEEQDKGSKKSTTVLPSSHYHTVIYVPGFCFFFPVSVHMPQINQLY